MQVRLTEGMLKAIAQYVYEARTTRGILDVYKAAESIRIEHIAENVAREDIIEKLVHLAGLAFVPIEFNKDAFGWEGAWYGDINSSTDGSFTDALRENESVH